MLSLLFIVAFVLCFAIAAFCVLIGYELVNTYKSIFNRFYFYYLIAFLVFAIYAFWGQIGMQALLASMDTPDEIGRIIRGFMPILGLPFLIIAMIMFLRMAYALIERPMNKKAYYVHLIVSLIIGVLLYGFFGMDENSWPLTKSLVFPLALLMAIETLYLLFFAIIVVYHLKMTKGQKHKVILQFIFMLLVGLLLRGSSLALNEVPKWALPFLILVYFLSPLIALWYLRQRSDILFEPIGAVRVNTDKKEALFEKYQITPREQEIIEQICLGKTNQQIADTLFISLQTVKDHTHRIYTKVGIHSRMKLVRMVNS